MSGSKKWQNLAIAAGGAAVVSGVLYYLFREVPEDAKKDAKPKSYSDYTQEDVLQILRDISSSQELMKEVMRDLTKRLGAEDADFMQAYKMVKEVQPQDPLERHQVTMEQFDQILKKHQDDPAVREAITRIMGAPSVSAAVSSDVSNIDCTKIISIHEFMLEELKSLSAQFEKFDRTKFDMKTVTIAAQALVGTKVEKKFGVTSEDIEGAVLLHHAALRESQEFDRINSEMEQTMGKLMEQDFSTM